MFVVLVSGLVPSCRKESATARVESRADLRGLTLEELIGRFGEPRRSSALPLSQRLHGPRRALLNLFPPDQPGNQHLVLKDVRWVQGDHILAVWLQDKDGAWVAVDACRWHKHLRF